MEIILHSEIVYLLLYVMSVWVWAHSCKKISNECECVRATLCAFVLHVRLFLNLHTYFSLNSAYVCLI